MTEVGPEFNLTTDPIEIERRRDEAGAILTTAEKPTEEDFRRALGLVLSTIRPLPNWTGYPEEDPHKSVIETAGE